MKTTPGPILLITLMFVFACADFDSRKTHRNALLPEKLIVFSPVPFRLPGVTVENDSISLSAYNRLIIDKALSGELEVFRSAMYPRDLKEKAEVMPRDELIRTLDLTDPGQKNRDEEINSCVDEIRSGFFAEEWYFDQTDFSFFKRVIQYQPVRLSSYVYRDPVTHETVLTGDTSRVILFAVVNDDPDLPTRNTEENKNYIPIVKGLKYELELYNQPFQDILLNADTPMIDEEKWAFYNFIYFKDFNRERFVDLILDGVLSGQVPAFDPADLSRKIGIKKVYANFSADTNWSDEPGTTPSDGVSQLDHRAYIPREDVRSVYFLEDWYYNKKTFVLVKSVRAIIPVRHETIYDNWYKPVRIKRTPVFAVRFDLREQVR